MDDMEKTMNEPDKPNDETYTLPMETLLNIFLDGMGSGITSALINTKYGTDNIEGARGESSYQMSVFAEDPALIETARDTVRARINGLTKDMRTMLKMKGIRHDK